MKYTDALLEAERLDKVRQDWEQVNADKVEGVKRTDLEAVYNRIPGAPPNMNHVKHQDYPFHQVVKLSDGIYMVPPGVLLASADIIRQSTDPLPLSLFEEDCWVVKSWLDDLDW